MAPALTTLVSEGARNKRRALGITAAVLAYLLAVPGFRAFLRRFLNRLASKLKDASQPAIQKDFLSASSLGADRVQRRRALNVLGDNEATAEESAAWNGAYAQRVVTDGGELERFENFAEVLPPWLCENLNRNGFDAMKPIQKNILPIALAGRDVVGIAPTGSGKTLAFLVPGLVHAANQVPLRSPGDGPIVLVLAPTRELAVQIGAVAEQLLSSGNGWGQGNNEKKSNMNCAVIYGGARRTDQLQTLRSQRATHVLVATPGRLLDFLEQGCFKLRRVSFFVLDEGDRMLDLGFEDDVQRISAEVHPNRQLLFFSATWPEEVSEAALRLCGKGKDIEKVFALPDGAKVVERKEGEKKGISGITMPPKEIIQQIDIVRNGFNEWSYSNVMDKKIPLLLKHLEEALGGGENGVTPGKALIFVGTRRCAEELGQTVADYFGLDKCGVMHGLRKQDQREATLRAFRDGRLRALVATDVIGRGVDIPDVSHVIIFDFPGDIETYVHRVGRTGRNGRPGKAIAFFEPHPWYPEMADDLVQVLQACSQEVSKELAELSTVMNPDPCESWKTVKVEGQVADKPVVQASALPHCPPPARACPTPGPPPARACPPADSTKMPLCPPPARACPPAAA